MSRRDALRETLLELKAVSADFQDEWKLIGSAAAHIAGADVGDIHDVDLVLSPFDARALALRWKARLLPPPPPHAQFRSDPFYRFDGPLTVEAMANFEINIAGDWRPVDLKTRLAIDGLFVPDVEEQIALLKLMGRAKDAPRIEALEALL